MNKEFEMQNSNPESGRFAREHGVPLTSETPQNPEQFFKTVKDVSLVNTDIKPNSVSNAARIVLAKIKTVEQNFRLPLKLNELTQGLEENMEAIHLLSNENVGNTPGLSQVDIIDDTLTVKKVAEYGLAGIMLADLAGCTLKTSASTPESTVPPQSPAAEVSNIVISEHPTASAPAGSIETLEPTEAVERKVITKEDTKNLPPDPIITVDSNGNLSGLPAEISDKTKEDIKLYYDAILRKWPGYTVYYSPQVIEDPEEGQWVFYPISPEGKLPHWIVSYDKDNPTAYQLANYPIYYDFVNGECTVVGEYTEIDVSSGQKMIWNGDITQMLINKINDGSNTYFTHALNYLTIDPAKYVVTIPDFQNYDTGPEGTEIAKESYPTSISLEQVIIAQVGISLQDTLETEDSFYVENLVAERKAMWMDSGLNLTDNTKDDFLTPMFLVENKNGKVTAWDYVLVDKDGHVAKWMQVKDETQESGWKWAEASMWDEKLVEEEGMYQFGLPEKLTDTDYFGTVYESNNEILTEYDKDGNAKRWLNTEANKMEWIEGVEKIVYVTPESEPVTLADAKNMMKEDAEVVALTKETGKKYLVDLASSVGIQFGPPPNYHMPENIVNYRGDILFNTEGKTIYGLYLREVDGSAIFVYRNQQGITTVIPIQ